MNGVTDLISAIGSLGITGALAWFVYAFYVGKIVPEKIADKRAEDAQNIAQAILVTTIQEGLKRVVKEAYIEAWYELKSSGERMYICPFSHDDIKEVEDLRKQVKRLKGKS
jgi:hypothetical protein